MAKKGKGRGLFFFGTLGIALSLIPIMGKVKSVLKNTKKKAKKKRKKKRKKKIGKVFTKARKLLNMLPLWRLAMKIKWAVKKAALARKKTTKKSKKQSKTQATVKQAKKNTKAAGKTYSVHDGEPITTLEDLQLVLGGGNHTRTSNEPSMIGQFIYSLLLEDIVTLVNPKSTTEERLLAGISMLPTSKPFKVLDAKKSTSKIIEDSRQTYTNNSKKNNGQKENGTFSNTNSNSSKTPEVEVTEKDVEALGEYYKKNLDKGTGKTLGDVLSNKNLTNQTNKVDNYVSDKKGFEAAQKDFDALNPSNVKTYPNGTTVGTLPDGRTINVRPKSSGGYPTTEIYDPKTGKSIKIRY